MRKVFTTIVLSLMATAMTQAQLKVTSVGKVGINTTNPQAALDLGTAQYGTITGNPLFLMYNDNASGPLVGTKAGFYADNFCGNNLNLVFAESAVAPGLFTICGKNTSGTTLNRYFNVAGTTGNVGIGTEPTTTDKLYVNGHSVLKGGTVCTAGYAPFNIALEWTASGNYPVIFAGSNNVLYIGKPSYWCNHVYATSIDYGTLYQGSDKRLKENIKGVNSILPQIKKINSYTYNYNDIYLKGFNATDKAKEKKTRYGFIAQELKDIFPELVITDDSTGYLKVDYVSMIPIIVEAMKEQSSVIDSLKNMITDIQSCCKGNSKLKSNVESETETTNISILTPNTSYLTSTIRLYQNAPNPFKESTAIKLEIPETVGSAMVCIYDLTGRQLKCLGVSGRGTTSVQIFGNELTAGLYHYALIADGNLVDTKTMVLTN